MIQRICKIAIAASVLLGILAANAWAYTAEVGARAANFRGYDLVNRETVELDDYLGQWVYIDFWATWCGPCMHDLPEMLAVTKPYVDSGRLKVITVNADRSEDLGKLKRTVRDLHITYPVLYDGGIYDEIYRLPIISAEWNVTSYPSTFLINPQGVIVANYIWGDEDLGRILDFYLTHNPPVRGVNGYVQVHDDVRTVSIFANVLNQGRKDVDLRLSAYLSRLLWDANGVVYDSEDLAITPVSLSAKVSFTEYSETTYEFVITPGEEWHTLSYSLWLAVPGAEEIVDQKGRGYELLYSPEEFRLIKLEPVDGEWVVVQE